MFSLFRNAPSDKTSDQTGMSESLSNILNFSRWVSALLVVIAHIRSIVFINLDMAHTKNVFFSLLYFLTGFGEVAVTLFFVLSGYLVGGSALIAFRDKRFCLQNYMTARFSRIYIVLIPPLLLGLTLDMIGSHSFNNSHIYSYPEHIVSLAYSVQERLSVAHLVQNTVMLQTITTTPLGSNGPLWSLANEWWYYCLFGLFLVLIKRDKPLYNAGVIVAMAASIAFIFPPAISLWFLIWLLGAGTAVLQRSLRLPSWIGLPLFLVVLVLARVSHAYVANASTIEYKFTRDIALSLAFCLFLASAKRGNLFPFFAKPNKWLADFSYSVYLFHFPILVFIAALTNDLLGVGFSRQPNGQTFAYFAACLFTLYSAAYALSRLTEAKTPILRAYLNRTFNKKKL